MKSAALKSRVAAGTVLEGGCLCGAIRFKVTGPALDRGSCHCRSCRKASSPPELPYAQFALSHFEITSGWPAQYHSSAESRAASADIADRRSPIAMLAVPTGWTS